MDYEQDTYRCYPQRRNKMRTESFLNEIKALTEIFQHLLLTSLVLTTGNIKASNAPFSMWTCSLETQGNDNKL